MDIILVDRQELKDYLLVLLASFVLRLPTIPPQGNDSFAVYWMANKIVEGYFWYNSPLSYFGFTPFSGYPIGGILVVAFLIKMLNDMTTVFFVYTLFVVSLGSFTSYFYFKSIVSNRVVVIVYSILYMTIPIFVIYTWMAISFRGLLISILPIFFYFSRKIAFKKSNRYWIHLITIIFLTMMIHRSAVLLIILASVIFMIILMNKIGFSMDLERNSRKFFIIIWVTIPVLVYISTFVFTLNPKEIVVPNAVIRPGVIALLGIAIDLFHRFGFILVVLFIQFILVIHGELDVTLPTVRFDILFSSVTIFSLSLFLSKTLYTANLLIIPLLTISASLMETQVKSSSSRYIIFGLLISAILYPIVYIFIISTLSIFLGLFAISIIVNTFLSLKLTRASNHSYLLLLIVISLLIFTMFRITHVVIVENQNTFPRKYITLEEKLVAEKIRELPNFSEGRILFSNGIVARHISAYAQIDSYYDIHGISFVLRNEINRETVYQNAELKPISQWGETYIFDTSIGVQINENLTLKPDISIIKSFILVNGLNNSDVISALNFFKTRYIVTGYNNLYTTDFGENESPFITQIMNNSSLSPVYKTDNLQIWDISNLLV